MLIIIVHFAVIGTDMGKVSLLYKGNFNYDVELFFPSKIDIFNKFSLPNTKTIVFGTIYQPPKSIRFFGNNKYIF